MKQENGKHQYKYIQSNKTHHTTKRFVLYILKKTTTNIIFEVLMWENGAHFVRPTLNLALIISI